MAKNDDQNVDTTTDETTGDQPDAPDDSSDQGPEGLPHTEGYPETFAEGEGVDEAGTGRDGDGIENNVEPVYDTPPDTVPEALLLNADELYDPSEHSVDEVKSFVEEHPEQAILVLNAEQADKNRVTLVNHLQQQIADNEELGEPPADIDEAVLAYRDAGVLRLADQVEGKRSVSAFNANLALGLGEDEEWSKGLIDAIKNYQASLGQVPTGIISRDQARRLRLAFVG